MNPHFTILKIKKNFFLFLFPLFFLCIFSGRSTAQVSYTYDANGNRLASSRQPIICNF